MMKRIVQLTVAALLLTPQATHASIFDALIGWFPNLLNSETVAGRDLERVNPMKPAIKGAGFVISTFDDQIVAKFREAWLRTGNGMINNESVVLIQRMSGDRFKAQLISATNQYKCFTFDWHPATIAIVHTHPNSSPPKPQDEDIKAADKFGVPIFTLTLKGVFVYDPTTKQISKIIDGLDWTQPGAWAKLRAPLTR